MMQYDWAFNKKAEKQFKMLDHTVQKRIIAWLNSNISGTTNPRIHGKALEGDLQTLWRYRVGKFRIIADIKDDKFIVAVIKVAKRGDVYLDH